jgi:hypothetical protein
MDIEQFRDGDRGYLTWTAAHAAGYVINVQRSLNPSDARLHRADCYTINGQPARGKSWTGPYIKVCSSSSRHLQDWARGYLRAEVVRCGTCRPPV